MCPKGFLIDRAAVVGGLVACGHLQPHSGAMPRLSAVETQVVLLIVWNVIRVRPTFSKRAPTRGSGRVAGCRSNLIHVVPIPENTKLMSSPGATVSVLGTENPQAMSCTTLLSQVLVPASDVPPASTHSVARLASAVFTPSMIAVKFAFASSALAVVPFVNVQGTVTKPVVSAAFTPFSSAEKLAWTSATSTRTRSGSAWTGCT